MILCTRAITRVSRARVSRGDPCNLPRSPKFDDSYLSPRCTQATSNALVFQELCTSSRQNEHVLPEHPKGARWRPSADFKTPCAQLCFFPHVYSTRCVCSVFWTILVLPRDIVSGNVICVDGHAVQPRVLESQEPTHDLHKRPPPPSPPPPRHTHEGWRDHHSWSFSAGSGRMESMLRV